jgi:hypothetical protein
MIRNLLRRPSPALVVASLALLVALTGTSYAAVSLAKNSVGTAQLKPGAVTSPKVKDASLGVADLAPAARLALKGQAGPQGPAGPKGDAGDRGPAGIVGLETVGASSNFDSSPERKLTVSCPTGKKIVGGGGGAWGRAMISIPAGVALTANHPLDDNTWLVAAREVNATDTEWFLRATLVCVAVP